MENLPLLKDYFLKNDFQFKRYFEDNSSCELVLNSFFIKISKKNKKTYFIKKSGQLNKCFTIERYYFSCKYMKKEMTAHQNNLVK